MPETDTQTSRVAERRTAPRASTRIPVELVLRGFPDPLPARAVDVGPSGICVSTVSPFPLRELGAVAFTLGDRQVSIPASGRWQRLDNSGGGLVSGIQFTEVEPQVTSGLRSFVFGAALDVARFLLEKTDLADLRMDDALDAALLTRAADYGLGRRIYEQGQLRSRGDSLFIVEEGKVDLEAQVPGTGRVVLDGILEGGIFAGLPLLTEMPHSESAIAATDVRLIEIDPYNFASLESTRPRVARGLIRALTKRRVSGRWGDRPPVAS